MREDRELAGRAPLPPDELDALIERAHWQSARSVEAYAPHQYVVQGWDKDDLTEEEFWRFVATIRRFGRTEEWTPPPEWTGGRVMTNRYLYPGDGFAYWFTWPATGPP